MAREATQTLRTCSLCREDHSLGLNFVWYGFQIPSVGSDKSQLQPAGTNPGCTLHAWQREFCPSRDYCQARLTAPITEGEARGDCGENSDANGQKCIVRVSSVLVRLNLHFHVGTQARVLKILDRLKSLGLVTFQLEEDNKPEKIGAALKFDICL